MGENGRKFHLLIIEISAIGGPGILDPPLVMMVADAGMVGRDGFVGKGKVGSGVTTKKNFGLGEEMLNFRDAAHCQDFEGGRAFGMNELGLQLEILPDGIECPPDEGVKDGSKQETQNKN